MLKDDETALEILAQHWIAEDPQHMFDTLRRRSRQLATREERFPTHKLARQLFERWPRIDPEAAIAALSVPDGIVGGYRYRTDVFVALMDQDPERGIGLISKWSIVNTVPRRESIRKWVSKDPRKAAEAVLENPHGAAASTSARMVAEIWSKDAPEDALAFMLSRPDRLSLRMQEMVLKNWASRDFDSASAWLGEQDIPSLLSRLTPHLIEAWAAKDAEAAVAWCRDNLDGAQLANAYEKLAKGAATRDVKAAAAMVSTLDQSPARTRAAVAVAKEWFPTSQPSPKKVTPEAIAWLRDLEDPKTQGKVLHAISWGWSTQDRDGLKDFLSTSHAAEAPDYAFYHVADDWAKSNPEEAFQWTKSLPEGRSERIASRVFEYWFDQQPDNATAWLGELPESDPRRPSIVGAFARHLAYASEGVAEQRLKALKTGDLDTIRGLRLSETQLQVFLDHLKRD